MNTRLVLAMALGATLFASAIVQAWVVHVTRVAFVELQELEAQRDEMNVEWGRLQIEQAAWSTHSRIEQVASEQLQMRLPDPDEVVIVRR